LNLPVFWEKLDLCKLLFLGVSNNGRKMYPDCTVWRLVARLLALAIAKGPQGTYELIGK
tara:strand:- start:151 stop:327 length:177 start_codon:yes stop_codon:yes gene_type:complete